MAISKRWQEPETAYRFWHRNRVKNNFILGEVDIVKVEKYIYVVNIIVQQGVKTGSKGKSIRYDAVEKCLEKLAVQAEELAASVHMPRIGCGLAPIIKKTLLSKGIEVFVYDY